MATIGVAVSVPDPWGSELQRYRVGLGDAAATGIPTHITLLPPTEVDDALLPGVEEHLRQVAAGVSAFRVQLRGTGTFRPVSPVVFVNVVQGISRCEQLAAAVRRGPLAVDARYPYHPHVTVAHDLPEEALDRAYVALQDYDAAFLVWGFTLFEQDRAGVWRPQRDFPFGGGGMPGPRAGG